MSGVRAWLASLGFLLLLSCNSSDEGDGSGAPTDGAGCKEPEAMVGITAAHNAIRADVMHGEPLPALSWSCSLAKVAQDYADELAGRGCDLEHSGGPYGENLYWSFSDPPSSATPDEVVAAWAEEQACYEYGEFPSQCTPMADVCGDCGHYTQVVWRDTSKLGCGQARCGNAEVWVCNYDPPGNYLDQYPY